MTEADKEIKEIEQKNDPKSEESKEKPEAKFTQADLDKIAAKTRAEAKAQADKEYQAKIAKLEDDAKKAKMTEDERAQAEIQEREKKILSERDEYNKKYRTLQAELALADEGIISKTFTKYIVGETEEETKSNVKALKDEINAEVKKQIESSMARGAPPATSGKGASNPILDNVLAGARIKPNKKG